MILPRSLYCLSAALLSFSLNLRKLFFRALLQSRDCIRIFRRRYLITDSVFLAIVAPAPFGTTAILAITPLRLLVNLRLCFHLINNNVEFSRLSVSSL